MLVISRKKTEKIIIGDDIEITLLEVRGHRVRVGIQAPKHVVIHTRLTESPQAATANNVKPFKMPSAAPTTVFHLSSNHDDDDRRQSQGQK